MDEINFIAILFALVNLLIALWVPLTSGPSGVEAKRVLAWCAVVTVTLIIPSIILTWSVMQISARILAPSVTNLSTFVSQIAWSVGAFSALYPLIWGIKFYPYFERYVSKLLTSPKNAEPDSQVVKKEVLSLIFLDGFCLARQTRA